MRENSLLAGTVELRSGAWSWSARSVAAGITVVFHHRQRARDEMRAWTPEPLLTIEEVRALARDPVTRVWTDSIGLQWSVSTERVPMSGRRRRAEGEGEGVGEDAMEVRLVFQRGGVRRSAIVGTEAHLGELTRAELQELFDSA